jgi:hypothetical protein
MRAHKANGNGKVKMLSRDEGRALFDAQARRLLDMSGQEFILAWDAGHFKGQTERPEVIEMSMLLPFGR